MTNEVFEFKVEDEGPAYVNGLVKPPADTGLLHPPCAFAFVFGAGNPPTGIMMGEVSGEYTSSLLVVSSAYGIGFPSKLYTKPC